MFDNQTKTDHQIMAARNHLPDQSITGFKMIFDHQNLGIDTLYVQIHVYVILTEI